LGVGEEFTRLGRKYASQDRAKRDSISTDYIYTFIKGSVQVKNVTFPCP
jgi:hypothetical protein